MSTIHTNIAAVHAVSGGRFKICGSGRIRAEAGATVSDKNGILVLVGPPSGYHGGTDRPTVVATEHRIAFESSRINEIVLDGHSRICMTTALHDSSVVVNVSGKSSLTFRVSPAKWIAHLTLSVHGRSTFNGDGLTVKSFAHIICTGRSRVSRLDITGRGHSRQTRGCSVKLRSRDTHAVTYIMAPGKHGLFAVEEIHDSSE